MRLIIISGRSGSGKSTALNQLEDEGFYCIDNLPASLLPAVVEKTSGDEFHLFQGTAVCIDARNAWRDLKNFRTILESLPSSVDTQVLFLNAQEVTLLQRFGETRRRHPLSTESIPLAEAIDKERGLLEPISASASLVLDTSQMTIYELRDAIKQRLLGTKTGSMSILVQSFGFKRGVPADADLVFDVRMLPNPHWIKDLRLKSGLDAEVQEFLESQPMTARLGLKPSPISSPASRCVVRVKIGPVGCGCSSGRIRPLRFLGQGIILARKLIKDIDPKRDIIPGNYLNWIGRFIFTCMP